MWFPRMELRPSGLCIELPDLLNRLAGLTWVTHNFSGWIPPPCSTTPRSSIQPFGCVSGGTGVCSLHMAQHPFSCSSVLAGASLAHLEGPRGSGVATHYFPTVCVAHQPQRWVCPSLRPRGLKLACRHWLQLSGVAGAALGGYLGVGTETRSRSQMGALAGDREGTSM